MQKAYKLSILYYLLFSLLLIVSAVMLFEHKIGFSFNSVVDYYIGNKDKFIPSKSVAAVLKIALAHILSFGLLSLVLLHFLVFTKHKHKKETIFVIYLTFITALLEIFTPLMIVSGFEFFAYLKLASFFLFLVLLVYIPWLLFISIVKS